MIEDMNAEPAPTLARWIKTGLCSIIVAALVVATVLVLW